jgi:hypothetical protein
VIYEGRAGSTSTRDIQGAHLLVGSSGPSANPYSLGIALLGNFNTAQPSAGALSHLADLIAWKAEQRGLDPLGSRNMPGFGLMPTIFGHRDGDATECPGTNLYNRLPAIRQDVAELIDGDQGGADLDVSAESVSETSVEPGQEITGACRVTNEGDAEAEGTLLGYFLSSDATWDPGDEYLNEDGTGTLVPGESTDEEDPLTIPEGTAGGDYYILFVADHERELAGEDRSNNVEALPITVSTVTANEGEGRPSSTTLRSLRPNPTTGMVSLAFDLATSDHVRIEVFDVVGRHVATIVEAPFSAGAHTLVWSADGLPDGVYVCRMVSGAYVVATPITLVR